MRQRHRPIERQPARRYVLPPPFGVADHLRFVTLSRIRCPPGVGVGVVAAASDESEKRRQRRFCLGLKRYLATVLYS